MQGRLTPPVDGRLQAFPGRGWRDELPRARALGLGAIEWIVESPLETNPLWTDDGVEQIRACVEASGVRIDHVCADCFIEMPLLRVTGRELARRRSMLARIIRHAAKIGARGVDVPFLDASAIHSVDEESEVCRALQPALDVAQETGIRIGLETSLPPARLAALVTALDHPAVGVTYDVGNSAALGYDPADEVDRYGTAIVHVHLKDRTRGGGSVPLGTGAADFPRVFQLLDDCGYAGAFTLQAARGEGEDEVATVRQSVDRLREWAGDF
jgi:hexulose-6-phosphate isomerase